MDNIPNTLVLPVFGGQESVSFDSELAEKLLLTSEKVAGANLLLGSCHSAFLNELACLPLDLCEHIRAEDFQETASVLNPRNESYLHNPIVSGATLVLRQSLQYLQLLDDRYSNLDIPNLLTSSRVSDGGILGFSSGILCAAVVASSTSIPSIIDHALEAYRLAFWIGARVLEARLKLDSLSRWDLRPWALVLLDITESKVEKRIHSFNEEEQRICLTAYIDNSTFTVSGHPDHLADFKQSLPDDTSVFEASINGIYHSSHHLSKAIEQVMSDIVTRGISFPTFESLHYPLRSCATGELVKPSLPEESLVKLIVRMIMIEPVRWDRVVQETDAAIQAVNLLQLLNVGLGRSLLKKLEKSLSLLDIGLRSIQCVDVASLDLAVGKHEAIAIVGMAVNLPKARDVQSLWDLLSCEINTAEDIPFSRFDLEDYRVGKIPGRELKATKANFVQSAAEFDNKFFNISPREANSMDPQQRLLLHVAYEALEDAGYVPDSTKSFAPNTFGCYIGAATSDYLHNLREEIDVYYSTGTLSSFLSGRLSYHLGLGGPSMVIDTACSSSLVAIHQAARALINGDCSAALVGGVNIISSPEMFIGLDRAHFLSPSGKCKAFDASADGYGRAEGCCIFVLKRLKDALLENDRIHGIIRGIEVNQSGKSHSITHPHGPTQQELFKKLLTASTIRPMDVSFVEAHGTGTQVGDVIEMESIRAVLAAEGTTRGPLHIGSVKANLGHLEAASGVVSLAKVLMMIRNQSIPAQISLEHLNPRIAPLGKDNCRINTERVPWSVSDGKTRIALINNFGASGSNAAALVEEYSPITPKAHHSTASSYVFGLSAKDDDALKTACLALISWLQRHPDVSLLDLSYTLTARRISYVHRLAISATTVPELITGLNRATPARVQDEQRPIVFVFSGQGGHYLGMGSALYRSSPVFREYINECDSILIASGFSGILPLITGESDTAGHDIEAYQAATFSLQYGLAKLWISWGVYPTALVAHSLGEYAALVISGCLTLRNALIVVATRARLMFGKCGQRSTGMLSVSLSAAEVQLIIGSSKRWSGMVVSCVNSPTNCVVSGALLDLPLFQKEIESTKRCRVNRLDVPFAFHSPAMLSILGDLQAIGNKVTMKSPSIPFASAFFGRVVSPGDHSFQNPEYFARHCSDPVRFADALDAFISSPTFAGGTAAWIEIGPHPTLLPMLKSFPQLSDSIFLPSLHNRQACWTTLTKTLAALYLFHTVNWRAVFAQIGPARVVSLPSYSFSTQTFWIPFKETISTLRKSKLEYSFIRSWVRYPSDVARANAIFDTTTLEINTFLRGHQVAGFPLCPASVYLEFAAAGAILTLTHLMLCPPNTSLSLRGVAFRRPLIRKLQDGDDSIKLRLEVNPFDATFSIISQPSGEEDLPHATGNYILLQNKVLQASFEEIYPTVISRACAVTTAPADTYSARTIYEVIFPRIVSYSKIFHTVRQLSLLADGLEAAATVYIGSDFPSGSFVVHPLFVDTLIHVPGFVANLHGGQTHAYICSGISSVDLIPALIDEEANYTIYCVLVPVDEGMVCTSYAIREGRSRILVARAEGIRFQRVRLSNLKASFATHFREITNEPFDAIDSRLGHIRTFDDHPDSLDSLRSSPKSQTLWESSPRPSNVQASFRRVLSDVLKIDYGSIQDDDELGSLGLDSLSSIEIAHMIRKRYQTELPSNLLSPRRTVVNLEAALRSYPRLLDSPYLNAPLLEDAISKSLCSPLVAEGLTLIQESQLPKSPLVLIHDGSGFITPYCRMSNIQRCVYGIINPNLTSSKPWLSITQMAHSYAALVEKAGHRSVILGGWSFGGILAFEISKVLQDSDVVVVGVLLIDAPDPFCRVPLSADLLDEILANHQATSDPLLSLSRSQFSTSSRLLGQYDPSYDSFHGSVSKFAFLKSTVGYVSSNGAEVTQWLADRSSSSGVTSGWEVLTGAPMKVFDIPGHHFQAFDSSIVGEVSKCVAEACDYFDLG